MSHRVFVGYFETEDEILDATTAARKAGLKIHDVYTPYAVHGMDEAMGLRASRLTWVAFIAGMSGAAGALALQWYTSVVSWPLNVGGKPLFSWPAFVPIVFELGVLSSALVTVAALFLRNRMFPWSWHKTLPRVTNDRFALALSVMGAQLDLEEARELLTEYGACDITIAEVEV